MYCLKDLNGELIEGSFYKRELQQGVKEEVPNRMSSEVLDARFRHPFTCVVSGPSQSGKSTFVRNLLLKQNDIIDTEFDYVFIFLRNQCFRK